MYNSRYKQVEYAIADSLGIDISYLTFTKLSELPSVWKHSCVDTGVCLLNANSFMFNTMDIYYAYCDKCNKVLYYTEQINLW